MLLVDNNSPFAHVATRVRVLQHLSVGLESIRQMLTTVTEGWGAYRSNKAELDVANDGIVGTIQAVEQGKIVKMRTDKDEMAVEYHIEMRIRISKATYGCWAMIGIILGDDSSNAATFGEQESKVNSTSGN